MSTNEDKLIKETASKIEDKINRDSDIEQEHNSGISGQGKPAIVGGKKVPTKPTRSRKDKGLPTVNASNGNNKYDEESLSSNVDEPLEGESVEGEEEIDENTDNIESNKEDENTSEENADESEANSDEDNKEAQGSSSGEEQDDNLDDEENDDEEFNKDVVADDEGQYRDPLEVKNRDLQRSSSATGDNKNADKENADSEDGSKSNNKDEDADDNTGGEDADDNIKSLSTVKKYAASVNLVIKTSVAVITNPLTWVISSALLLLLLVLSFASIYGKNDFNEVCATNSIGTGVITVSADADDNTRHSAMVGWLTSAPFEEFNNNPMSREMAFAVIGSIIEYTNANPRFVGGEDFNSDEYVVCDNDCMIELGDSEDKPIGIMKWNKKDRANLIQYAIDRRDNWYSINIQMNFLRDNINSKYAEDLVDKGFNELTKTTDEYTEIWSEVVKLPKGQLNSSKAKAEELSKNYVSSSGLVSNCFGGNIDTSNLIQLAIQSSYTAAERAGGVHGFGRCAVYSQCGQTFAKPEYKAAKIFAEERTSPDPSPGTLASCDRYVATMIRATGVDDNYPWGNVVAQMAYMDRPNSGWERISCQQRMPGDVLALPGHIMLYLGMVDGRDSIGSASIATTDRRPDGSNGRTGHISNVSCVGDKFYADGVNSQGWRKIN